MAKLTVVKKNTGGTIAQNKRARHDYFIEEKYESGIELIGTEVKSIKAGKVSIKESFVRIIKNEVFIMNMHVSNYEFGNINNLPETRVRKLLLHRKEIEKLIDVAKAKDKVNTLDEYVANGDYSKISSNGSVCTGTSKCSISGETPQKELIVNIPFINKTVDLSKYSLPLVSFILGSIDGVNPCAMWVLVLFLTALVAVGNRTKMIQVAGLFLLAEAIMYYMILNVWLYTWDFVGLDKIITPTVGIVGIIGGIFFIRSFVVNGDELACEVTDFEKKAKISTRIQDIAKKPFNIITALAIIGLALSVNVIEFACSIGIPQTFTKILQMNDVNFITRQFYNFLYIIGYMLDDMLVFGLALFSVNKLHLTSRYAKWANLFGGILMVLLGLMLIFKPTWLIF